MSVPEVRRLLSTLREAPEQREKRLWWSRFRRHHQAGAKRGHVAQRARQHPLPGPPGPPLQVPGLSELTPERWAQVVPLLPPQKRPRGRPAGDHRRIVEGILWVMQTNRSWSDLPERFGPWQTVVGRYRSWCKNGVWERIRQALLTSDVPLSSSA